MSGCQGFYDMAVKKMTEAIACDNLACSANQYQSEGYFRNALALYQEAISIFMIGIKHDKNPCSIDQIKLKIDGYLQRCELIKNVLNETSKDDVNNNNKGDGVGAGKGNDVIKKKDVSDSKEEDQEKSKLRGALSSSIVSVKPNVKWDDVAGLFQAKEALKEAVILPIRFPQLFVGKRVPWKGILLYGPPGTGKSFLAKAVATEADSTFFSMSSSDLVSKWQGESERLVKQMFEMAREQRPSIIFVDEVDSLCSSRSEGGNESSKRILTEFLVQMGGVGNSQDGLLVLGATNVPWDIDAAMRRRFEKRVYIALPEASARAGMFKLNLGDTPNSLSPIDFEKLGEKSHGYSGSDIAVVVREALMYPVRKCQVAKQFIIDSESMISPCDVDEYPNCPYCPMRKSTSATIESRCRRCGAIHMTLYEIPKELQLRVPAVCYQDFVRALGKARSSVNESELVKFVEWTAEFGQEG